jgi:hypothetical protein
METSSKIDLEQFKPKPHPFREVFKRNSVTVVMLANYLGKHVTYVRNMLGGHIPMSKPVYEKLETLVKQIETSEGR